MNIKEVLFLLLAHHSRDNLSHTIKISIGKREIYLCARCTAIYSSLLISWLLFSFVIKISTVPYGITLCIALVLGIPVIVSWSKQTLTEVENSNRTRITTGIGGGVGLAMIFYLPTPLREFLIFGIFAVVFLILYFGKIRKYKNSYRQFQEIED